MNYLLENLSLLYNTSGWSYDKLSTKLNEGLPPEQQFTRDQIRGYEQRLTKTPKSNFKNVLAKFFQMDPREVVDRKLTVEEIEERINETAIDAGKELLTNDIELIAQNRVMLTLLGSIAKPALLAAMKKSGIEPSPYSVQELLQMMVEEEKEKVLKDKRRRL